MLSESSKHYVIASLDLGTYKYTNLYLVLTNATIFGTAVDVITVKLVMGRFLRL